MLTVMVKVKPGSSRDEIVAGTDARLLVRIRERPVEGAANAYLVGFLAKKLGIRRSGVILEKGHTSTYKKIRIDLSEEELTQKLVELGIPGA